jgi:hypothetical protein
VPLVGPVINLVLAQRTRRTTPATHCSAPRPAAGSAATPSRYRVRTQAAAASTLPLTGRETDPAERGAARLRDDPAASRSGHTSVIASGSDTPASDQPILPPR